MGFLFHIQFKTVDNSLILSTLLPSTESGTSKLQAYILLPVSTVTPLAAQKAEEGQLSSSLHAGMRANTDGESDKQWCHGSTYLRCKGHHLDF